MYVLLMPQIHVGVQSKVMCLSLDSSLLQLHFVLSLDLSLLPQG